MIVNPEVGGGEANIVEGYAQNPNFASVNGTNVAFTLPSNVKQLIYVSAYAWTSDNRGYVSVGTPDGTARMKGVSNNAVGISYGTPPTISGNRVTLATSASSTLEKVGFASYAYIPGD